MFDLYFREKLTNKYYNHSTQSGNRYFPRIELGDHLILKISYMTMMEQKNRRKHKRYPAKEGFFAGSYPNVGQIVNISMGGLAYNYMGLSKHQQKEGEMVICGDDCLCIDDLQCNVLSDSIVSNGTSFSKFVTRQRRLQFVNLTPAQKITLENFINYNRDEHVPS